MRLERVQCDALFEGCAMEIEIDDARPAGWLLDVFWTDGETTYGDLCPKCADQLALEAEHEVTACPQCGVVQDRSPDPDDDRNDICPPCVEKILDAPEPEYENGGCERHEPVCPTCGWPPAGDG